MSDEADLELQRLKNISAQTPIWLKCLVTGIATFLTVIAVIACIGNALRLIHHDGDASVMKLVLSFIGLAIALLAAAVSRDVWMLPKITDGKAKTWVM